jgi:Apc13p protein
MAQLPGHFLPFEEIYLPSHLMPVNPEDEDDVVPDMHAAFGINMALGQGQEGAGNGGGGAGQTREPAWRDFGLEELVSRGPSGTLGGGGGGFAGGAGERAGGAVGLGKNRKDGKRSGLMMMR